MTDNWCCQMGDGEGHCCYGYACPKTALGYAATQALQQQNLKVVSQRQAAGLDALEDMDKFTAMQKETYAGRVGLPVADPIKRPNHYARYAIEPITFIMANNLPFCVGNVVKYVLRYDAKNGKEDLLKARRYIDMILEDMARKEKGTVQDCVGRPL